MLPAIARLPTRVIDIGLRRGLREPTLIVPPKGLEERYVALSYCWWNISSKLFLSKTNAQFPNLNIPLNSLLKVLKDAFHITKRLRFRYLWINSLSLIQQGDDGEDFAHESVTMHKVYSDATLTIAAAAAHNVHEGILGHSKLGQEKKCQFPYDLPDVCVGTAFLDFEEAEKRGQSNRSTFEHPRLDIPRAHLISKGNPVLQRSTVLGLCFIAHQFKWAP